MREWSKGGSDCHCRAFGTHHSDRDLGITEIQVVTPLFLRNSHIHAHQAVVDQCVESSPMEHRLRTVRFFIMLRAFSGSRDLAFTGDAPGVLAVAINHLI